MNLRPHVCQGTQCEEIQRLRGRHWKYARIARELGISVYVIQRSIGYHARLRCRDGAASCLDCQRIIDPRVPDTTLLPADECCLWCGRRHDGDSRLVTTLLDRLSASERPDVSGTRGAQDLRTWDVRSRANSAELRARSSARSMREKKA